MQAARLTFLLVVLGILDQVIVVNVFSDLFPSLNRYSENRQWLMPVLLTGAFVLTTGLAIPLRRVVMRHQQRFFTLSMGVILVGYSAMLLYSFAILPLHQHTLLHIGALLALRIACAVGLALVITLAFLSAQPQPLAHSERLPHGHMTSVWPQDDPAETQRSRRWRAAMTGIVASVLLASTYSTLRIGMMTPSIPDYQVLALGDALWAAPQAGISLVERGTVLLEATLLTAMIVGVVGLSVINHEADAAVAKGSAAADKGAGSDDVGDDESAPTPLKSPVSEALTGHKHTYDDVIFVG